jgi:peroxin-7
VKIWDTKSPHAIQTVFAHGGECLTLDWNKYSDMTLVTGSVDQTLKVWDLRFPEREVQCLRGHRMAVRKVKCSPHHGNLVASVGYDMAMHLWNLDLPDAPLIDVHDAHTEFVTGLDWSLYQPGQIATCAWDEHVHVFTPPTLMMNPLK